MRISILMTVTAFLITGCQSEGQNISSSKVHKVPQAWVIDVFPKEDDSGRVCVKKTRTKLKKLQTPQGQRILQHSR